MYAMFYQVSLFNQPIGNWDVSSVTNMDFMFQEASAFNQPIGDWDVSSVTNMDGMFLQASNFNQDLNIWNVSSVNTCSCFSCGATSWTLPQPNFTNCNPD